MILSEGREPGGGDRDRRSSCEALRLLARSFHLRWRLPRKQKRENMLTYIKKTFDSEEGNVEVLSHNSTNSRRRAWQNDRRLLVDTSVIFCETRGSLSLAFFPIRTLWVLFELVMDSQPRGTFVNLLAMGSRRSLDLRTHLRGTSRSPLSTYCRPFPSSRCHRKKDQWSAHTFFPITRRRKKSQRFRKKSKCFRKKSQRFEPLTFFPVGALTFLPKTLTFRPEALTFFPT